MAREVIKKGADVRSLRKPINDAFASIPTRIRAEGAAASTTGDTLSFSVYGEDIFYIRIDAKTGTSPIKYAWTMMVQDRDTGAWTASPRAGLTTDDSYAVELNNASAGTGSKRYAARVNPQTGRVTFDQGGGGGSFTATSTETAVMILGTYDDYKNCPDVPPRPPTTTANFCAGTKSDTLCVPDYAYAVYQRCGYLWNKIGDTRTYQVWANEMNGGTISAFRRLFIPRWGGDFDPTTGLPDPDADCMGLAVLGYNSQGALSCTCPPCLSSPPPGKCIKLKFRTIPRPASPAECASFRSAMDSNSAWDKDYEFTLTPGVSGYCFASGSSTDSVFTFEWQFVDGSSFGCDWGPDVYDPCDPCAHWGMLYASIEVPGGNEPNCGGSGHWRGEFRARDVCNLLCSCGNGPVYPTHETFCDGCGNAQVPPAIWNVIVPGSMQIVCC